MSGEKRDSKGMERKDEELIASFQQGDATAFDELYSRYKKPIFNFTLRILNNRADAEDVTAEVFMKLFEKKDYYQPQNAKFSTWLFAIAYNGAISRTRSRRNTVSMWFNRPDGEEARRDIPSQEPSTQAVLIQREETQQVRSVIVKLPSLQKEALILREYHRFSYQEIAQIMNCSLEQVKVLIFRAREFLRQELPTLNAEDKNV